MKITLLFLALIMLAFSQQEELKACIQERCPDQFSKCQSQSGCQDKLWKCQGRCGAKVDVLCWTFCLGVSGPAADVAICAVNQGCLSNSQLSFEKIGKKIDNFLRQN